MASLAAGLSVPGLSVPELPIPAAPVIDFSVRSIGGDLPAVARADDESTQRNKIASFVNNLGRPTHEGNPNAGLRITVPTVAKVSPVAPRLNV
jgi:hypothetical protein